MFQYVNNKKEITALRDECESLIKDVQIELNDYFTFQFKLIGSGSKYLITQNTDNGEFDLDYNLILQRDKCSLINNPGEIKNLFINAFNKLNPKLGFQPAQNRKSVIKSRLVLNNSLYFSFDIAIMVEGNNGNLFKIVYDKYSQRYLWNEIKDSADFEYRFAELKKQGYFGYIKDLYLEKKNMHLRNGDNINSYATLLETVNQIWHKGEE